MGDGKLMFRERGKGGKGGEEGRVVEGGSEGKGGRGGERRL